MSNEGQDVGAAQDTTESPVPEAADAPGVDVADVPGGGEIPAAEAVDLRPFPDEQT